jgi:2-succinyl-5-enolpyruvyl-6-hydroxy-3-cyclohexene-1-carboxylate synthase
MDIHKSNNINYLWTSLVVEELVRCGVDYFCLSSGSRSAPLALAVAEHSKAKSFVHFDERGAAFHALGYVSATQKPCALISTSGSAAANFFPAIIEASKKKLPLIVITADRPPELRFTGANQAIDQVKMFGDYVRFFFDMPCPSVDIPAEFVLTTIDQLVSKSKGELRGPVHLNCMFREPLTPVKTKENFSVYLKKINAWTKSNQPYSKYLLPQRTLSANQIKNVIEQIKDIKRGVIVAGKLASGEEGEAVLALAETLNWPIFPDISSGLRLNSTHEHLIHYFDQILLNKKLVKSLNIDGVIHVGGRITSKRYDAFVKNNTFKHYVMVLNHPLRNDPNHIVTTRVQSSVKDFCLSVGKNIRRPATGDLIKKLQKANYATDLTFERYFAKNKDLSEPAVCRLLSHILPNNHGIFLANSLPIREIDIFAQPHDNNLVMTANRGASGIDGNLATAVGFSAGANRSVTALLGDLALLHDLNSLAMLTQVKQPVIVIVLNNRGGGIFNFLPIAQRNKHFEKFFGTPHEFSFEGAAEMFDINYFSPETREEFVRDYRIALKSNAPTLIEIETDREENVKIHREIQKKLLHS